MKKAAIEKQPTKENVPNDGLKRFTRRKKKASGSPGRSIGDEESEGEKAQRMLKLEEDFKARFQRRSSIQRCMTQLRRRRERRSSCGDPVYLH